MYGKSLRDNWAEPRQIMKPDAELKSISDTKASFQASVVVIHLTNSGPVRAFLGLVYLASRKPASTCC